MIKTIFFDFDGVILESAHIKTEAFRKLFAAYADQAEDIVDYHIRNAGVSRYVKFKHIYEQMLAKPYTKEDESKLAGQYSRLVLEEVKKAPFVGGVMKFLTSRSQEYNCFIVSAAPQPELDEIVGLRKLRGYFKKVCGYPPEKEEILKALMKEYGFKRDECVYVGDGRSDWEASHKLQLAFILRLTPENRQLKGKVHVSLNDLTQLADKIEEINGGINVK